VARKEDGFYIDPRTNGGINIEAITLDDVVITDGNGSVISRHAKRQNDGSEHDSVQETENNGEEEHVARESRDGENTDDKKGEESVTGEENQSEEKNTGRRRREVAASKDNDGSDSQKSDVQPVSILTKIRRIYVSKLYPKMYVSGKPVTFHKAREGPDLSIPTPWLLVPERTIPTDRPPLLDEI
jgi:hypothetical protein